MRHFEIAMVAIITMFLPAFAGAVERDALGIKTKDLVACMKTALLPELIVVTEEGRLVSAADGLTDIQRTAFVAVGNACVAKLRPVKVSDAP